MLPRYKCHKVVRAAKIELVTYGGGSITGSALLDLVGGHSRHVREEWAERHNPEAGGYFVEYEDGYTSYSPAEAFEAGYTLIEGDEDADA